MNYKLILFINYKMYINYCYKDSVENNAKIVFLGNPWLLSISQHDAIDRK